MPENYPTEQEIRLSAYKVIQKKLGTAGFIRFMQQHEQGQGNYTLESYTHLDSLSVDELCDVIGSENIYTQAFPARLKAMATNAQKTPQ